MDELEAALLEAERAAQKNRGALSPTPRPIASATPKPDASASAKAPQKGSMAKPGVGASTARGLPYDGSAGAVTGRLGRSFVAGFSGLLDLPGKAWTGIQNIPARLIFGNERTDRAIAASDNITAKTRGLTLDPTDNLSRVNEAVVQNRAAYLQKYGKASGFTERAAEKTAEFAGGSVVPFLGFLSWGKRISAGVGSGLQSSNAIVRFLARGAEATAKAPGVAVVGEVGASAAGGAAQTAAEDAFPDSPGAQLAIGVAASILGGGVSSIAASAVSSRAANRATGAIDDTADIVGWRDTPDGGEEPIIAFRDPPSLGEALARKKHQTGNPAADKHIMEDYRATQRPFEENDNIPMAREGAEDDLITLTAPAEPLDDVARAAGKPEPKDLTVGTITRADMAALEADVAGFAARKASDGARAVDVTWADWAEDAARVGEWRIGNLGDVDDSVSLLAALVRQLPAKTTRSDAELLETTQKAVQDIGEDPDAIMALGKSIAGSLGDADGAISVLRSVWANQSREVSGIGLANIDWTTASDDLVIHAAEAIRNMSILSQMVQQAKTGLGRGLRAIQLPDAAAMRAAVQRNLDETADGATPITRSTEPLPGLPTTREEIKEWLDLWKLTDGNPRKQAAMLEGLITIPKGSTYLRQSFPNFFTASILSKVATLALNVVGPGSISIIRQVERQLGAGMMSLNPLLSRAERQAQRALAQSSAKAYLQTFGDIQDVMRQAWRAAEVNHTIIGGGGQIDGLHALGPYSPQLIQAAGRDPSWTYTLGNAINMFPRALARVNNGLDEFSKRLAYQGEIRTNAYVEGAEQGLRGKDLADYANARVTEAYDETGRAADLAALRSAERTTLTSKVGEEGTRLRKFADAINRARVDVPELRYILPIFNVPMNALSETLRRLPIAAIPGVNKVIFTHMARELAGEMGTVQQADAYGRMMLGGAFLMGGMMLNRSGVMTGAGPKQPTDRKVWLQTHQPYSIRIGDQWVDYRKFDILGGILQIPATVADATMYQDNDQSNSEVFFAGVGALAQWFKDRAALRNATGLLALGDDPTKDTGGVFQRVGGTIAAGFWPAAIRSVTTDISNPYQTMKNSWDDYLVHAITGGGEPLRNVLGEPIQKASNTVLEAILPVVTVPATGYAEDPVLDELDRLYQETGYGAGADSTALGYGFFDPRDLQLENGESLYTHGMRMRQVMKGPNGKTLKQTLEALIKSPAYANAVDGDSQSRRTSRGELSRGFMVKEVFADFNDRIKAELASQSPKARAYLTAAAAKRKDDAYLRDTTVEELVNDPRLYQIKGINQGALEGKILQGRPRLDTVVETLQ